MCSVINLYSEKKGEIKRFLTLYFSDSNLDFSSEALFWKKEFQNPIDMIDIISCLIDNIEKFSINLWISLDKDIYICIGTHNINKIIKYLYERYPY